MGTGISPQISGGADFAFLRPTHGYSSEGEAAPAIEGPNAPDLQGWTLEDEHHGKGMESVLSDPPSPRESNDGRGLAL